MQEPTQWGQEKTPESQQAVKTYRLLSVESPLLGL